MHTQHVKIIDCNHFDEKGNIRSSKSNRLMQIVENYRTIFEHMRIEMKSVVKEIAWMLL